MPNLYFANPRDSSQPDDPRPGRKDSAEQPFDEQFHIKILISLEILCIKACPALCESRQNEGNLDAVSKQASLNCDRREDDEDWEKEKEAGVDIQRLQVDVPLELSTWRGTSARRARASQMCWYGGTYAPVDSKEVPKYFDIPKYRAVTRGVTTGKHVDRSIGIVNSLVVVVKPLVID